MPYLVEHHYTHVEFLPLAEYPFDGSWGYQGCGYFAPTQRIGGFAGFAALVDALHAAGIAVLMDFVPVHLRRMPTAWPVLTVRLYLNPAPATGAA